MKTMLIDGGGSFVRFSVLDEKGRRQKFLKIKKSDLTIKAGIRGVWTPEEKRSIKIPLKKFGRKIQVLSDAELAYDQLLGREPGVLIIAGTGAIALGRTATGKMVRAGGLGPLLGDEGSGFWIGREWLRRNHETPHGLNQARKLSHDGEAVRKIAALSKKVLAIAEEKPKSVEASIRNEAIMHLSTLALKIRKITGIASPKVAFSGGIFSNMRFRSRMEMALKRKGFRLAKSNFV